MDRNIIYQENIGTVILKTSGDYFLNREIDVLKLVIKEVKRNNCKRLLFDHRDATIFMNPEIAIDRSNVYKNLGFCKTVKMATVYNNFYGSFYHYEIECTKNGWKVKTFENYNDAIDWLVK